MRNSYNATNLDVSSINFIFAKPYIEHYYLYGINTIEELTLINKESLIDIINDKLLCKDTDNFNFVLEHNMPFLYNTKTGLIQQFKYTNDVPTKDDISNRLISEMKEKATTIRNDSLQARYNNLFKQDYFIKKNI